MTLQNPPSSLGEKFGIWPNRMKEWNSNRQLRHADGGECKVWEAKAKLKLTWNSFSPNETMDPFLRVVHNSQIARSSISKSTSWYGNHKIYHLRLFVGVQVTKWTSQFGACGLRPVAEQILITRALSKIISGVDNYHEMIEDGGEAVRHHNSGSGSTPSGRAKTWEPGCRFKPLCSVGRNLLNEKGWGRRRVGCARISGLSSCSQVINPIGDLLEQDLV
jgi:hypothetical protein